MVYLLSIERKILAVIYVLTKLADRLLCQLSLCDPVSPLLVMPAILQSSYRHK